MMLRIVFMLSFLFLASITKANDVVELTFEEFQIIIEFQDTNQVNEFDSIPTRQVKLKRGKAILFTVFTGFLGGHRIYFGTHHRTPIIYSITFGGLGILPIIDLIHIIFTKDLARYEHKSQIIMWGK
ncbi:MAG: TM2 domain-containing protein [Flavobacteriales bacterium]|nr:TM2 domain-containing protein [Flavobacteriales bacterium]